MKKFFSYIRVSSKEQADTGASLDAQRECNLKYAQEIGVEVTKEFKEVQSAAKKGRVQFNLMIKELKKRRDVAGIIFHDVDRSTRQYFDLAALMELSESGYEICYSRTKISLNSAGSKTLAGVQAVMAKQFIDNLSQETKKGMYKKAEQGFTVFGRVVIGYINKGGGVRELDPFNAPLIKKCFELYATNKYTLNELADKMYKMGLRNSKGKKIEFTKISKILNDRYYVGMMKIKDKIYNGRHKPIISVKLFNIVQQNLQRRFTPHTIKNEYKFQHILFCNQCGKRLKATTAKHKYHYYFCRHKECKMKSVLEEKVETWLLTEFGKLQFTKIEINQMLKIAKELRGSYLLELENKEKALRLQIDSYTSKLNKLTDMLLDGNIDKEVYNQKREQFIEEKRVLESEIDNFKTVNGGSFSRVDELAKLLANPVYAYKVANHENRANLIRKMTNNIKISDQGINIDWQTTFLALYQRKNEPESSSFQKGVPIGNRTRNNRTTTCCVTTTPWAPYYILNNLITIYRLLRLHHHHDNHGHNDYNHNHQNPKVHPS